MLLHVAGRRSWAFCTWEKNTSLWFFPLFTAHRTIGQRRPLLQVETDQLMLPDHRQKYKWNVTSCSWKAKLGTLHTERKNYLLALFTFVHGAKHDRAMSPSSASRNGSIDASKLSLEVQMDRHFMELAGKAVDFTHGKNYLLAILSFVYGVEGNEATLLSFATENKAIDASNSSLEVLIATRYMQRGCKWEHFTHGKPKLVCWSLSVYKLRGRRGNVFLFWNWKSSDWCFQLVAGSAQCNIANAGCMWTVALYPRQTKYIFVDL